MTSPPERVLVQKVLYQNQLRAATRLWTVKLDDLRRYPLCYVEYPDLGRSEALMNAMAPRVALGTLEAVQRFVSTNPNYLGVSVNWRRAWGVGHETEFDFRFLHAGRQELSLWLLHPTDPQPSDAVKEFMQSIRSFFRKEKKPADGKPYSMIIEPPDNRPPVVK